MIKEIFLTSLLILLPMTASAHGGMQKIVEGKYLLNISSGPISPYAGQEQQNIIAISDVATNSLIELDSIFEIEIKKGEETVHLVTDLVSQDGLLQFNYTYPETGIYELFARFRFPEDDHVYAPEDFWIQVLPAKEEQKNQNNYGLPFGIAIGIVIGVLIGRRGMKKRV